MLNPHTKHLEPFNIRKYAITNRITTEEAERELRDKYDPTSDCERYLSENKGPIEDARAGDGP